MSTKLALTRDQESINESLENLEYDKLLNESAPHRLASRRVSSMHQSSRAIIPSGENSPRIMSPENQLDALNEEHSDDNKSHIKFNETKERQLDSSMLEAKERDGTESKLTPLIIIQSD